MHYIIDTVKKHQIIIVNIIIIIIVVALDTVSRQNRLFIDECSRFRIGAEIRTNRHASFPLSAATIDVTLISSE